MTDQPAQPPNPTTAFLSALSRHALSLLAGVLVTDGVIAKDQETQFIAVGASIVAWGLAFAWSRIEAWRHGKNAAARVEQAAETGVTT